MTALGATAATVKHKKAAVKGAKKVVKHTPAPHHVATTYKTHAKAPVKHVVKKSAPAN